MVATIGEEPTNGIESSSHSDTFRWLFYDEDIELFGCRTCHLAFVSVDGVRAHIKSNNSPHPEGSILPISYVRKIKKKPDAISSMKDIKIGEITPNWSQIYKAAPLQSMKGPSAAIAAIPWLALHDGFSCPICRFCHRNIDSLETHLQKSHPLEWNLRSAVLRMQVKNQLVQTLLLGKAAKYFPVILDSKLSYWFSGEERQVAKPTGIGKCGVSGSVCAPSGHSGSMKQMTFDDIAKLCKNNCLDGTKPRRSIFDELSKANTVICQNLVATTKEEMLETGFGSTHTYSNFLALSRFDVTLQQCGFNSFANVPLGLSTIRGPDGRDSSFKSLQTDILEYLRLCGTFIYDSAPYIRDILQLTGYAGSNLRKFKSVEDGTLVKYSRYLAHILLIVLRTFSSTEGSLGNPEGRRLFPPTKLELYKKLASSYGSSHSKSKEVPLKWVELSDLFKALFLVCIPGESSTRDLSVRQLLALLSVTEDIPNHSSRGDEYYSDYCDGNSLNKVKCREGNDGSGMRRFKTGSEMSHLFASILYCASCTAIYAMRCGENGSKLTVEFVKKAVSLHENTAVAFVRDLLDKTTADRNADSSVVRFSLCLDNPHAQDVCGVIDGKHLSLGTVRAALVRIEDELMRVLEYDLLLTLPVPLKAESSVLSILRDRHTEPQAGFSFMEMEENKEMVQSSSRALLEHVLSGSARKGGWAVDDNPVSVGDTIRKYYLRGSEVRDEKGVLLISGDRFEEKSVRYYLLKCQRFLQLILVYFHIVGGGPARCTEICTVRHRNGAFERRNIFIDHSLFCFLYRYNKNRSASEKEVSIARFIPRQVSHILLVYLMYVRPLENLFSIALTEKGTSVPQGVLSANSNCNEFLFVYLGTLYSASRIREMLTREFSRLGVSTNASQWRQFQNGMEREFMNVITDQSGDGYESHDVDCPFISVKRYFGDRDKEGDPTQAGHSRRRADLSYARAGEVPRGITYTSYMRHRTNSILWHNMLGICCTKRRNQCIRNVEKTNTGLKFESRDFNISSFAKSLVRELVPLLPLKRVAEDDNFKISEIQSRKIQKTIPHIYGHRECSTGTCQHQELSLYQEYLPYLRSLTGDKNAEFRSRHQLCAISTAINGKRDMLLILGTGSGKTMIYLLVAYIETKRAQKNRTAIPLTVVVVPTRALVQDIRKRCKELGVTAVLWAERKSNPKFEDAAVILLAVEQVLVNEYAPFLEEMRSKRRLARIVSEECHLMIQWRTFRPHMDEIRHRISGNVPVPIPIIMASATVSPFQEKSVIDAHGVDPARLSIVRDTTYRRNIAYSVLFTKPDTVAKTSETDKMARIVIECIEKYQIDSTGGGLDNHDVSGGRSDQEDVGYDNVREESPQCFRVVIYCPTKDICRRVGSALSNHAVSMRRNWTCAQYTADLDPEDRDEVFEFWTKQEEVMNRKSRGPKQSEAFFVPQKLGLGTRIVVATSAFGTGIDVPNVRMVFHIGFCRGLYSFAQESGRAGRDNRPAKSIVVYSSRLHDAYKHALKDRTMKKIGVEDSAELEGIEEFTAWALDCRRCRRKTLFGRLDDSPPPTCLVSRYHDRGVALCDSCAAVSSFHRAGIGLSIGDGYNMSDLDGSQHTLPSVQSDVAAALAAVSSLHPTAPYLENMMSTSERDTPLALRGATTLVLQTPRRSVRAESTSSKQKMAAFMQMARKLKDICAFCFVEKLKQHEGREDCLPSDACFNCFETGRTHSFKDCPLDLARLLEMDEDSCKACGLNRCMGMRVHKNTEWNFRGSCPYRSVVEMFFVAWRSPSIRRKLCKKLDRAEIYVLPEGHRNFNSDQIETELRRFIKCIISTRPGETVPNIVRSTELLFETIGYTFIL